MKRILKLFLLLCCLCGCSFSKYDYTGWKEVEIPTNTDMRGTIKIPYEWEFTSEDNIIKLINMENNEVIMEQIAQYVTIPCNISHTYTSEELAIMEERKILNEDLNLDVNNKSKYSYVRGYSNCVEIYEFYNGNNSFICLLINACDSYYEGYTLIHDTLFILYHDLTETIEQMIYSYYWGGHWKQQQTEFVSKNHPSEFNFG